MTDSPDPIPDRKARMSALSVLLGYLDRADRSELWLSLWRIGDPEWRGWALRSITEEQVAREAASHRAAAWAAFEQAAEHDRRGEGSKADQEREKAAKHLAASFDAETRLS